MKHKVLLALLASGLVFGAPAAMAATKSDKKAPAKKEAKAEAAVVVSVKPPSGQWEGKPPPAQGWIWRAGYYAWTGERFEWKPGEWILDKEGMDFRQYSWVEAGDGKWKLVGGDWVPEKHS